VTLNEVANMIGAIAALVAAMGTVLNGYRAIKRGQEASALGLESVSVGRTNTVAIQDVKEVVQNGYHASLEKAAEVAALKVVDVAIEAAVKLAASPLPVGVPEDRRVGAADRRKGSAPPQG
jgi:hypothetical protein